MATTYPFTLSGHFSNVMPSIPALRAAILAALPTLDNICVIGNDVQIIFTSALSAPQEATLLALIQSAKYGVDTYTNLNTPLEVKAQLHTGPPINLNKPKPLLSVNSGSAIQIGGFLTPAGLLATEDISQVIVPYSGTLCGFSSYVNTALLSVGTRTFTVRVNGVPTAMTTSYGIGALGLQTSNVTVPVVAGDRVCIHHGVAGIMLLSVVMASLSIV